MSADEVRQKTNGMGKRRRRGERSGPCQSGTKLCLLSSVTSYLTGTNLQSPKHSWDSLSARRPLRGFRFCVNGPFFFNAFIPFYSQSGCSLQMDLHSTFTSYCFIDTLYGLQETSDRKRGWGTCPDKYHRSGWPAEERGYCARG